MITASAHLPSIVEMEIYHNVSHQDKISKSRHLLRNVLELAWGRHLGSCSEQTILILVGAIQKAAFVHVRKISLRMTDAIKQSETGFKHINFLQIREVGKTRTENILPDDFIFYRPRFYLIYHKLSL